MTTTGVFCTSYHGTGLYGLIALSRDWTMATVAPFCCCTGPVHFSYDVSYSQLSVYNMFIDGDGI